MASNIAIQISSNVQQAVNGINAVNQRLEALQKDTESVSSRFQRLSSIAGGATIVLNTVAQAFQKASAAVRACVEAYSAQEQAERRLQTVLTATQNAVGMSAAELYNLAQSLSEVTAYSDQEIMAVEQMLIATRKIGRDVMPEATKAVLDMAAAIGDDAAGAAKDLAQALSDPAGEIESLKEKGIQLTEAQAENIKKVQEQNGLYEAQKLLLQEVAETYGGMAEAIAATDTGKLQKIADVWNDIKEGLGEGLLNTIGPALDKLYERLLDIEGLINKWTQKDSIKNIALSGGSLDEYNDFDLLDAYDSARKNTARQQGAARTQSEIIEESLRRELEARNLYYGQSVLSESEQEAYNRAISGLSSGYGKWLSEYRYQTGREPDQATIQRGIDVGQLNASDIEMYNRYSREKSYYDRIIQERMAGFSSPSNVTPSVYRRNQASLDAITDSLVRPGNPAFSLSDYISGTVGLSPRNLLPSYSGGSGSSASMEAARNPLGDFLNQYGSLSTSRQVSGIEDAIRASQQWMAEVDPNSDTYKQLKEINEALYEQRDALLETEDAAESWQDQLKAALPEIIDGLMSVGSSFSDLMQNLADTAADKLQEIEDKWDEYFESLDEKQGRQMNSLNAMLSSGNISYEDYIDAMNALDKTRAEAEEEATKEKEEQQRKANELGKAAFVANQVNAVAEASINAALSITDIWSKYGSNPVMAGVLTGLSAAATAAQIAAISSQQYTPMAAGGITEGPTRTLLGEGNPHELVMPLTEGNLERFGIGGRRDGGVINLTINIGAAYTGEQLSEDIFRGIERAQRTGALPRWRYA